jgi:hypothetical protein
MKLLFIAALLIGAAAVVPAIANDSTAQLGTGGLIFLTNEDISMDSEDLSISQTEVKVVYEFTNKSEADQHVLVAFPLPDIQGDGDFNVAIPTEDPDNLFGFTTTFDGKPVDVELHQYVFSAGVDRTELLKSLGVPLAPFGQATIEAINKLGKDDQQNLLHLGMVIPMTYDAGNGEQTDWTPIWTLRSTYTCEADFKAGSTSEVVHTY